MAEDYSVNLKANLNTADVQEKLNDLRFKGTHATSDLEIAVKKLDNAVQDLTRTWEKQAEAARKAAENAEEAAKANGANGGDANGTTGAFLGQATGLLAARRLRGLKKIVEKVDGADGEMSEGGTVLASSLGWAGSGAAMGSAFGPAGTAIGALAGAIYGVKDGFD